MRLRLSPKARRIVLAVGVLLIGAVLAVIWSQPKQPRYQGRTVEQWMNDIWQPNSKIMQSPELLTVFKKMDASAVPVMINHLSHRSNVWDKCQFWFYGKSPNFIHRHLARPVDQDQRVLSAILALGQNQHTHEFLPELVSLLEHPDLVVQLNVAELIATKIKPGDEIHVLALTKALTSPQAEIRASTATALGQLGGAAHSAGTKLAPLLCGVTSAERRDAAKALFNLHVKVTGTDYQILNAVETMTARSRFCGMRYADAPEPPRPETVLSAATKSDNEAVAHFSAIVFNYTHPGHAAARARLAQSLTNADPCIRLSAAYSLVAVTLTNDTQLAHYRGIALNAVLNGNADARERLAQAQTNTDASLRLCAAYSLTAVAAAHPAAAQSFQKTFTAYPSNIEAVARMALGR